MVRAKRKYQRRLLIHQAYFNQKLDDPQQIDHFIATGEVDGGGTAIVSSLDEGMRDMVAAIQDQITRDGKLIVESLDRTLEHGVAE